MKINSVVYIFFHPEITHESLNDLASHYEGIFNQCSYINHVYLVGLGLVGHKLKSKTQQLNGNISNNIVNQLIGDIPDSVKFIHDDYTEFKNKNKQKYKNFDTRPYKQRYIDLIPQITWTNLKLIGNVSLLTCEHEVWSGPFSGIGTKRAISQMFHLQNYQNLHYIGIDHGTCPLYSENSQHEVSKLKYATYGQVLNDNFIKNEIKPHHIIGFLKGTEPNGDINDIISHSNSLYKFIIIGSDVINLIYYDPFLIDFKEDVDWLSRASQIHSFQFRKIYKYWLCKDRRICADNTCSKNNQCPAEFKLMSMNKPKPHNDDRNYFIYLIRNMANNYTGDKFYVKHTNDDKQEITYLFEQKTDTKPSNGFFKEYITSGKVPTLQWLGNEPYYSMPDKTTKLFNKASGKCGFTNYDLKTFELLKTFSQAIIDKEYVSMPRTRTSNKRHRQTSQSIEPIVKNKKIKQLGGYKEVIVHKGVCFSCQNKTGLPIGIMYNNQFHKLNKTFVKSVLTK
jgi:hypothetical protein